MLKTFGAEETRERSTPQVVGLVLEPDPLLTKEKEKISNILYRNLIGTLMHLQRCTRPDISITVRELSRFLNCNECGRRYDKVKVTILKLSIYVAYFCSLD